MSAEKKPCSDQWGWDLQICRLNKRIEQMESRIRVLENMTCIGSMPKIVTEEGWKPRKPKLSNAG